MSRADEVFNEASIQVGVLMSKAMEAIEKREYAKAAVIYGALAQSASAIALSCQQMVLGEVLKAGLDSPLD